jgi:hypothetical protein
MELCIYHGIKFQVQGLDGKRVSQMSQCTGSESCHDGNRRNNFVLVKQCPGRCCRALNQRLPSQMQGLFTIKLLHQAGALVECWLALALTTLPENSSNLDPICKLVQQRKAPAAVAWQVVQPWEYCRLRACH